MPSLIAYPYVFYFFSYRTKYFEIHYQPANGTFGFAPHTSQNFAKPKEPFLPSL
jgi:hypothetical protein